jgi:anti-sigma factor ChrR (cupin superfamily)
MTATTAASEPQKIVNPPDLASHIVAVNDMPWSSTEFPGIEMKMLYSDRSSGASTVMFRMQPGAIVPPHEHTALEQTFILSGSLKDDEGEAGPGEYVWRPGGNRHVAHAPNGAVFISFFLKPNKLDQGTRFFTE